ncbi:MULTISPECIES: TOBE domain-containing protein [Arthrobacter]|uniref:TOBE domain-containing protein n=2 Tax=Arthrobacter TaxID=1663 RepID=A0ABU9KN65_9MICC|nr:TOBE domain-containing protein [Arthrobacter sp. YJM1]MDP5228348.1 TOBE domain-containing protein [Arthrobacter sp. YJM1]
MSGIRIKDAAAFLGVSDDTVRRWLAAGQLKVAAGDGVTEVDALSLASLAREQAAQPADPTKVGRSARNRMVGLVTRVVSDTVMSQVEMQCGPHRIVSLMSTEAVQELGIREGKVAVAVVKATNVIVEVPDEA